jgi:hypothetical protein
LPFVHFFKVRILDLELYENLLWETNTQFICSIRDVYIAIALCSSLLHSEIAIHIDIANRADELGISIE